MSILIGWAEESLVPEKKVSLTDAQLVLAREKLAKILDGFDPKKLIVAATHTHTLIKIGGRSNKIAKDGVSTI